ncbi:MAG: hypothetical protein AAF969_10270 [Bacteroidota bacterium]
MVNTFTLSRNFWEFSFSNPEKVKPIHGSLYHFIIHVNNQKGWVEKFRLPTENCMDAIGVKNYKTYINALLDLAKWDFIEMVQRSKNQYTANIIALVKNTKAQTKALTKALSNQLPTQVESIDSNYINLKTSKLINLETEVSFESLCENFFLEKKVIVTPLVRTALNAIKPKISFKLGSSDEQRLFDHFKTMYLNLASDSWWKSKRKNIPYLNSTFEEAYEVGFNVTSSTDTTEEEYCSIPRKKSKNV